MKRYGVYRRVSTEEQSRPGHVSLDAQLAECIRYVERVDGTIFLSEHDVETGHNASRAGYQKLKDAARRREIDAIVVWKLDRFGRNFREWVNAVYELEQEIGITVESVSDSNDPLTRNIMMSVAEQYLRDLSKHTINGLRYRAAKGEWSGAPPIGYDVLRENGISRLVPNEKSIVVARIFAEAATGFYSLSRLSEMAKDWGLRGRTDHYLSRQALGKILRNPTYRGAVVYGRKANGKFSKPGPRPKEEWIVVEEAHAPIVDVATWNAVQLALTRHRVEQGTVRATKHLLTSLIYCGVCAGEPGPDGKKRTWRMYGHGTVKGRYYECSRKAMYGACSLQICGAGWLEESVTRTVRDFLTFTIETRERAGEYIRAELEAQKTAVDHQRIQLQRDLEKHQQERRNLARQRLGMVGAVIPEDIYLELEQQEAMAVSMLEREIAAIPASNDEPAVSTMLNVLAGVSWDDLDADDWRQLLGLVIQRIVVHGRDDVEVQWLPSAAILGRAAARVSH